MRMWSKRSSWDSAKGAIVVSVSPNSAAQKAGLQSGDIILAFDGHSIEQGADCLRWSR